MVSDVAFNQPNQRVLFGSIGMTGQSQRLAYRVSDAFLGESAQPQYGRLAVVHQMGEEIREWPAEVEMVRAQREHDVEAAHGSQCHEQIHEWRAHGLRSLGQQFLELIND